MPVAGGRHPPTVKSLIHEKSGDDNKRDSSEIKAALRGDAAPAGSSASLLSSAESVKAPTAPVLTSVASPKTRDASGRFTTNSQGGRVNDDDRDTGAASAISGMSDRVTGAIREISISEESDPSVKAFNEVAQPLSRGFGKIFSSNGNKSQDRWFRRIWREMLDKRRQEAISDKKVQRTLDDIEKNGQDKGESGSWFGAAILLPLLAILGKILSALLPVKALNALKRLLPSSLRPTTRTTASGTKSGSRSASGGRKGKSTTATGSRQERTGKVNPGTRGTGGPSPEVAKKPGIFSKTTKGLGKGLRAGRGAISKIPLLGAILGLGFMASDVIDSESSDGTRKEKDIGTGAAVGRGVGGMGGMVAGAAAGAAMGSIVPVIGTAVGSVVGGLIGGWLGDSAGDIIGAKFGEWVNDLRSANISQSIVDKWNFTADFVGSLWGQASDGVKAQWATISESVSQKWTELTGVVSAAWSDIASKAGEKWDSAVASMQSGWTSVVEKASGLWDGLTDFASKANDYIKDKTGIDVSKEAGKLVGKAEDAYNSAKESVSKTIDSAKDTATQALTSFGDALSQAAKKVADATGVTTVVDAVKRSYSHAENKAELKRAMAEAGITDPKEQASFMGQLDHESAGFTQLEESMNYKSPERLMEVSATARSKGINAVSEAIAGGPESVAELMYGGRMGNTEKGDAYKYRGRGFIHLTGKDQYDSIGKSMGIDLVNNPELAADPQIAARIATEYWKKTPGLRKAAQSGDVEAVTKKINGGTNGLDDRVVKTQQYLDDANSGELTVSLSKDEIEARRHRDAEVVVSAEEVKSSKDKVISKKKAEEAAEKYQVPNVPLIYRDQAGVKQPVSSFATDLSTNTSDLSTSIATAPASPSITIPKAVASTASPSPVMASTVKAASIPSVPEMPTVTVPMGDGVKTKQASNNTPDVSRDVSDRRIAHVVTGAYSGF